MRLRHALLPLLAAGVLPMLGCGEDPVAPQQSSEVIVASDSALVEKLATAYRERDAPLLAALLADRDEARFVFVGTMAGRTRHWGAERERRIHRRMFDPASVPEGEPPVPPELWVHTILLSMRVSVPWSERHDLYREPRTNPLGLDPGRWRATQAKYVVNLSVLDHGSSFADTYGSVTFVVVEDLLRPAGTRGKFLLYRWEDETLDASPSAQDAAAVDRNSWTRIKNAYAGDLGIDSEAALVDTLARAYATRDPEALASRLGREAAAFRFDLAVPTLDGHMSWDADTERLVLWRMLRPRLAAPPVVASRLWLLDLRIELVPRTGFVERTDVDGAIDRRRWRATEAEYATSLQVVLYDTTHIQVNGLVRFTVLEDRALPFGEPGKFVLYRWQDLGPPALPVPAASPGAERMSWSELKLVYLPPPPIDSEATLVRFLARAYRERDYAVLGGLLAYLPGSEYRFLRHEPDPVSGEFGWDHREEFRLHVRMFAPEKAGTPPLPADLHLQRALVQFTPQSDYAERSDLYATPFNPGGLDRARWRATEAIHSTAGVFEVAGWQVLRVGGDARFVVIQDLTKVPGSSRRFLLYRWEDLGGPGTAAAEQTSWTELKLLYR